MSFRAVVTGATEVERTLDVQTWSKATNESHEHQFQSGAIREGAMKQF
jgi:hypothetical protein